MAEQKPVPRSTDPRERLLRWIVKNEILRKSENQRKLLELRRAK